MKKLFMMLAVAAFAVNAAAAQEVAKKPSFKGFETNGFWDNWEISLRGGVNMAISSGDNYGARKDRIGGLEVALGVTKWMHPVVGIRGVLQGGYYKSVEPNLTKEKWPYMFGHFDVMVNFSNWVGGYREDRVYYAVPYAGGGLICSNFARRNINDTSRNWEFGVTAGLLNKFRVCPKLDIDVEFQAYITKTGISSTKMNGRFLGALSASVGLTYRFGQRDWKRAPKDYISADEFKAYQDANAKLQKDLDAAKAENDRIAAENNQLKNDLIDAQQAAVAAKSAEPAEAPKVLPSSSVILFECGSAELTSKEKTRLDIVAEVILEGDENLTYALESHADAQTGSREINAQISSKRSQAVYDYLIRKGVKANRLKIYNKGAENNPFESQTANRSVVIYIE